MGFQTFDVDRHIYTSEFVDRINILVHLSDGSRWNVNCCGANTSSVSAVQVCPWHSRPVLSAVVALTSKVFLSIGYSMRPLTSRRGQRVLQYDSLDIHFISEITHKHKGEEEPIGEEDRVRDGGGERKATKRRSVYSTRAIPFPCCLLF